MSPLLLVVLKDDDLDNLTLEYTSFSENKINKKLVWEFVVSLIVKRREPLVNEVGGESKQTSNL